MTAPRRPLISRTIDTVTEALGHQWAFVIAVTVVAAWLAGLPIFGLSDQYQLLINTSTTIITFVMVFAVQHTSNQDARALHVKLDELLRVTDARNALIGAEAEAPDRLKDRQAELREHGDHSG